MPKTKRHIIKKLLPILLLAIVLVMMWPNSAEAGWKFWDVKGALVNGMLSLLDSLFNIIVIVTGWSGKVLDISIDYSLGNSFYELDFVKSGWATMRNITNLFFIFSLIFIGIATILQLQKYHYRQLLVKIIIAALLVNFSMVITMLVIDASNVLAMEFLCAMTSNDSCKAGGWIETTDSTGNDSLAATLANGLSFQTIFGKSIQCTKTDPDTGACTEYPVAAEVISSSLTPQKVVLIYILGSFLMLIAAFVLFAGAIFFILRTLTFMFLIIFSPVALVAMAFGSGLGKQWWDKLLNQAFFAPAYLFLIYLVVLFISGTKTITGSGGQSFYELIVENNTSHIGILMQFILMAGMLIGSLVVAQNMGAMGAKATINWGDKARKRMQGYAGKVSKKYTGRVAVATEEKLMAKDAGRFAKTIRTIPLVQRGLAHVSKIPKKQISEYEKQYKGHTDAALKGLKGKIGTSAEARKAMEKILKTRMKAKEKETRKKELDNLLKNEKSTSMEKIRAMQEQELADAEDAVTLLTAEKEEAEIGKTSPPPKT